MSTAAQLLKQANSKTQPKQCESAAQVSRSISVPTYGRESSPAAAARLLRIKSKQLKSLETEVEAIKAALRDAASEVMDSNADAGIYSPNVSIGCAKVSRANKFAPVPFAQEDVISAIGETNYRMMYDNSAIIQFNSIDDARNHATTCSIAGISVIGEIKETVKANSKIMEFYAKAGATLDPDVRELIRVSAKDQAPRVMVK